MNGVEKSRARACEAYLYRYKKISAKLTVVSSVSADIAAIFSIVIVSVSPRVTAEPSMKDWTMSYCLKTLLNI